MLYVYVYMYKYVCIYIYIYIYGLRRWLPDPPPATLR